MDLSQLIACTMRDPPLIFDTDGTKFTNTSQTFNAIQGYLKPLQHIEAPVGIVLKKGPYYFITILACMNLGISYVPLSPTFPHKRLNEIKEDAGINLVIDQPLIDKIINNDTTSYPLEEMGETIKKHSPDHPLYIIFTSGTTGRPKGVEISRQAFTSYALWLNSYLKEVQGNDRVLQITEFTFDISLIDLILFLWKKTNLYFSKFTNNIFKLAAEISDYNITVINTVPNNLNMLLADAVQSRSDLSSLRHIMIGGARFSFGLYKKVQEQFSSKAVYNFYGPTECTIYSHALKLQFNSDDTVDNNVSIGVANDEVRAEVIKNGEILPPFEKGELCLSGKQLLTGYKNKPDLTDSATFSINKVRFYKTGDLAFKNDNDSYFIVGRLDETIKYRGYRINLLDIDSYILKLDYVQDVKTIAIPDEIKENKTISYIILKREESHNEIEIKNDLKHSLLDYQIPERIFFIDTLPINSNGKVSARELVDKYQSET